MNASEQERIEQLLKKTLRPMDTSAITGPRRDLWPAVLQRLDDRPIQVPWLDWALLAAVAAWLAFFPGAIPVLLYHL